MAEDFEIASCDGDDAGKAYLSIKHLSGAEISVQHLPFDTDPNAPVEEQASLLEAESKLLRGWPTQSPAPGSSPNPDEAPNVFGQSTSEARYR